MKFVHIGDCQLGFKQYGLAEREEDFYKAVGKVVDRACDIGVDAFVWPGDIFDAVRPPAQAVQFLKGAVDRLTAAGITSLGIDGNHDVADSAWLNVCGIKPLNGREVKIKGVSFYGLNYMREAAIKDKIEKLAAQGVAAGQIDVVVLHQSLAEMANFPGVELSATWLAHKLKPLGVKYVALGDIHIYKELVIDGIRFVYPGSTEMNAMDEPRDKCFIVVEIDQGNVTTFIEPIETRPIVDAVVTTEQDLEKLFKTVKEEYSNNCLVMARVNSDLADVFRRIHEHFGSRVPFRTTKFSASQEDEVREERPTWERTNAVLDLNDAVVEFHKEGSDECQLILEALETPDDLENIVTRYLESRGVELNERTSN
jgi:DNA repair exonuclease SbcCD nuclease subunit